MRKRSVALLLLGVFVLGFALVGHAESVGVEESFKANFPHIKYDSINPTDIKGIYEIVVGTNIGYFAPEPGYLIVGEIRDKNGTSLTANRRNDILAAKVKGLPLDKAVKIGSGPSTVIEFTDPDCPFCRKASKFLSKRTDATRYVFLLPLPSHPDSENKVRYIFCAEDKAKAYEEAMSGKLDDRKYQTCKKPESESLLKEHKELATKIGVRSTPFFVVNGKAVAGADMPKLEAALKAPH